MNATHCLAVLLVVSSGWIVCRGDENEYRLLRYLLSDYDASARPTTNSSLALQVVFSMSLHLIIDVDERNQILTTNCWLTQKWNDSRMSWNTSDFGGIQVVRIPYQRVWRPDIILYNNADANYGSAVINTNVIVYHNGYVTWLSHGIFRSSCEIDVAYFPFDIQSCKMKWASWTYDGYQIDLEKETESGDLSNYQTNGEFDLVGIEAIRHEEFYSCCPEPYPDITYIVKMRRRPLFYVFNLILPCILINGIALLVFYVPSESGEKVTLGISSLLSMTVFLMTIRESLPPTEKTPLISLYYGVSICLVSFASGLSVVTLNLHHRGLRGTEVPCIVRRFVLGGLARLVFLHFDAPNAETESETILPPKRMDTKCTCRNRKEMTRSASWYPPTTNLNGVTNRSTSRISHERLRLRIQDLDSFTGIHLDPECAEKFHTPELDYLGIGPPSPRFRTRRVNSPKTSEETATGSGHGLNESYEQRLSLLLSRVTAAIERNESRLEDQDRKEAIQLEWKQIALVCDRTLLLIFLVVTTVATCVVLMSSPYGP